MKALRLRLCVALSVAVPFIGAASPALALANRVFVSQRSGNDSNPCSNILTPCQTFAGAVLQLNPGGEAIVLDSGGYGPVTITQALTIEAPPGVLAFIHPPSGAGITISAGASDTVILRGLTINGPSVSVGISVGTVGALFIENCSVSGFVNGIEVDQGVNMLVKDSLFRANTQAGVDIVPNIIGTGTAHSTFDHCRFEYNGSFGLAQIDGSVTVVRDSVVSHNGNPGGDGLDARTQNGGGTTTLTVTDCLVSYNGAGVLSYNLSGTGTPTVSIGGSTVNNNISCGLRNISATFNSLGNNLVTGNSPDTCGTITVVPGK